MFDVLRKTLKYMYIIVHTIFLKFDIAILLIKVIKYYPLCNTIVLHNDILKVYNGTQFSKADVILTFEKR